MTNALLIISSVEFYSYLIQFALFILQIISFWFLFVKAGVAGWKSIIPIYSDYKMYQIIWKPKFFGIYILLTITNGVLLSLAESSVLSATVTTVLSVVRLFALLAACVIQFFFCRHLAFSYGKGTGFAIGLFFLYPIFTLILGLGNSKFVGKK